jgi:hypothetical protein
VLIFFAILKNKDLLFFKYFQFTTTHYHLALIVSTLRNSILSGFDRRGTNGPCGTSGSTSLGTPSNLAHSTDATVRTSLRDASPASLVPSDLNQYTPLPHITITVLTNVHHNC